MNFPNLPTNLGWECPKCGGCYAPHVSKCSACPVNTYTTGTVPLTCTCGQTAACPLHPLSWQDTTTTAHDSIQEAYDEMIIKTLEEVVIDALLAPPEPDLEKIKTKIKIVSATDCGCSTEQLGPCPLGPFNHA